jgi:pimeloyl-ACP methyl ester carboxylesterase
MDEAHFIVLPGAGSAGLTWAPTASRLDALVLPLGDESSVREMAAAQREAVNAVPRPRALIGSSLGAMVAMEMARSTKVDALVLVAAGFGVHVSDAALEWVESDPPGLIEKLARIGLGDPGNQDMVALRVKDFEARGGQPTLLQHLRALAGYHPDSLPDPPPTMVLWGPLDKSVPLVDHAELALELGGLLVPIAGSGHAPFLECPEETARWIRASLSMSQRRFP